MHKDNQRWLITGAGGQLGSVLLRTLTRAGHSATGLISPTGPAPLVGMTIRCDLTDRDSLSNVLSALQSTHIVHAAAVTNVQSAFENPGCARKVNVDATAHLVQLASQSGSRLVYISTDLVFDGKAGHYRETDAPLPLSVYGQSKLDGERLVLAYPGGAVARLPLMYGLPDVIRATTFRNQLQTLRDGQPLRLFEDEFRSPLWLDDAAEAVITIAQTAFAGLMHVAGPQRLSRLDMGRIMATALHCEESLLIPTRQWEIAFSEPRPSDVSLCSDQFAATFGRGPGRPMSDAMAMIIKN
ncbi:MAG: SDR family oxidoreductase [Planctomycetes bacterium]|nr:SDR family oxidoreductase [Planctomycetota bacterium]